MERTGSGPKQRTLPRPFSFHWGSGQVVEEASYVGRYHQPAIQLLEYPDGSLSVRFCFFNHSGQFQRSPLVLAEEDLPALREALQDCPRLQTLLKALVLVDGTRESV